MSRLWFTDSHWSLGNSGTSWKLQQKKIDEIWSLFPDFWKFFFYRKKKNARPSPRSPSGWRLGVVRHPKYEFREWWMNKHFARCQDGFKNKNNPKKNNNVNFFSVLYVLSLLRSRIWESFFSNPTKTGAKRSFSGAFSSPPFETICQNRLGRRGVFV